MKKEEKNIFIGYSDESKAYRLYDPYANKLVMLFLMKQQHEAGRKTKPQHQISLKKK